MSVWYSSWWRCQNHGCDAPLRVELDGKQFYCRRCDQLWLPPSGKDTA
jgi:hypothetical protein